MKKSFDHIRKLLDEVKSQAKGKKVNPLLQRIKTRLATGSLTQETLMNSINEPEIIEVLAPYRTIDVGKADPEAETYWQNMYEQTLDEFTKPCEAMISSYLARMGRRK